MSLICKSRVRRLALDEAANTRRLSDGSPRFIRVKKETLDDIDARVRVMVVGLVHALPSAGRTI